MDVKRNVRSDVIIVRKRERERRGERGRETEFRRKMKLLDTYLNIKNVVMSATES